MDQQAQRAYESAMTRDLDDLVAEGPPASRATAAALGWDLPQPDIAALERWGVPIFEPGRLSGQSQLAGLVQEDPAPQIDRLGVQAYLIGMYFEHSLGAHVGDGAVYKIPAPDREYMSVALVNTSVRAFVESAWRWWWVRQALIPVDEAEEYEQLQAGLERFADWANALDPAAKPPSRASWWDDVGSW